MENAKKGTYREESQVFLNTKAAHVHLLKRAELTRRVSVGVNLCDWKNVF